MVVVGDCGVCFGCYWWFKFCLVVVAAEFRWVVAMGL